ncbi:MAG: alanine racemase [Clostridium sp.]|nr:alanine racemase [Clostridium sp.]
MKKMEDQRICARVDLDALHANIEAIEKIISPGAKIMGIIKANGYGHGAAPIGKELEKIDTVFGYGVATAKEALTLREAGLKKPILILGYTFAECYEELIEQDISMAVFRYDTLEELSACAAKLGKKAKIHIKVDTGMSRIGVFPDESGLTFVKKALSYDTLTIEGIFTHFARADEKDKSFAKKQFDRISQFWNDIEIQTGYRIPIKHCANSAGIMELPKTHMDMVRAGIILYGLWPSDEVEKEKIALRPVLSLKSHIVHIKEIEKGTSVSYGGIYTADRPMRIATIPVGYADGYPRALSDKGYVLIHGKKAPILGRICMDQFMVSVDDIPQAQPLDEVTLIGKDGAEEITMETLGDLSGRFNYEFACGLGERVPRIYIKKGKICEYTF